MRASRVREILIRAIYTGRLMGDPLMLAPFCIKRIATASAR